MSWGPPPVQSHPDRTVHTHKRGGDPTGRLNAYRRKLAAVRLQERIDAAHDAYEREVAACSFQAGLEHARALRSGERANFRDWPWGSRDTVVSSAFHSPYGHALEPHRFCDLDSEFIPARDLRALMHKHDPGLFWRGTQWPRYCRETFRKGHAQWLDGFINRIFATAGVPRYLFGPGESTAAFKSYTDEGGNLHVIGVDLAREGDVGMTVAGHIDGDGHLHITDAVEHPKPEESPDA